MSKRPGESMGFHIQRQSKKFVTEKMANENNPSVMNQVFEKTTSMLFDGTKNLMDEAATENPPSEDVEMSDCTIVCDFSSSSLDEAQTFDSMETQGDHMNPDYWRDFGLDLPHGWAVHYRHKTEGCDCFKNGSKSGYKQLLLKDLWSKPESANPESDERDKVVGLEYDGVDNDNNNQPEGYKF